MNRFVRGGALGGARGGGREMGVRGVLGRWMGGGWEEV